jgi:hypothetical protein
MHQPLGERSSGLTSTPPERDQDHLPMQVYSVRQVTDRVAALSVGSDEPFPALVEGLRTWESGGAKLSRHSTAQRTHDSTVGLHRLTSNDCIHSQLAGSGRQAAGRKIGFTYVACAVDAKRCLPKIDVASFAVALRSVARPRLHLDW